MKYQSTRASCGKQISFCRTSSKLSASPSRTKSETSWHADCTRTLSDTPIHDLPSLAHAIHVLHTTYRVPHVIITSLRLTRDNQIPTSRPITQPHTPSTEPSDPLSSTLPQNKPTADAPDKDEAVENLTIIGSTATSDFKPRLFRIDTPALPLFFSGTGDMFAALTVPRLLEAVSQAPAGQNLANTASWRSPDDVRAEDLPLARACQKVLASMQAVLAKTAEACKVKMDAYDAKIERGGGGDESEKKRHLTLMNASEVVVPRHVGDLLDPPDLERFRPRAVRVETGEIKREGDELGVLHLGVGKQEGAIQVEVDETEGSGFEKLARPEGSEKAKPKVEKVEDVKKETTEGQDEGNETQEQKAGDASKAGESVKD
jgi:pyridoxine kinase